MTARKKSDAPITPSPGLARVSKSELKRLQQVEASLLGSIISSEREWQVALETVEAKDFTLKSHQHIYTAIRQVIEKTDSFDAISVIDQLTANGLIDTCGGLEYPTTLAADNPSGAHIESYALIIKNASLLRSMAEYGERVVHRSLHPEGEDARTLLRKAEDEIYHLSEYEEISKQIVHISTVAQEISADIEQRRKNPSALLGLSSGILPLDNILLGFQPGDLIVLAARPSQGKTALALNIAQSVATRKLPVLFFSMEMSCKQLALRMLSSITGIDHSLLRSGKLKSEQEIDAVEKALALSKSDFPLFIEDASALNPLEVLTQSRMMRRDHQLSLIIIDYLQLMDASGSGKDINRVGELATITRSLKRLAKELQVPVIVLSQLSRDVEKRTDNEARLSDMRDSGTIEQDADVVMVIKHEKQSHKTSNFSPCKLTVLKHRNGPTGFIDLEFNKSLVAFQSKELQSDSHLAVDHGRQSSAGVDYPYAPEHDSTHSIDY